MFTLTEEQFSTALSNLGSRTAVELRDTAGKLIQSLLPHEVGVIRSHRLRLVEGVGNKRGFKDVRMVKGADIRVIRRLLLRTLSRNTVPRAEDSKTFTSTAIVGGGLVYTHIRTYAFDPVLRRVYT